MPVNKPRWLISPITVAPFWRALAITVSAVFAAMTPLPTMAYVENSSDVAQASDRNGEFSSGASFRTANPFNPYGFELHKGVYHCELNRDVFVRDISSDARSTTIQWNRRNYTLYAVKALTGALRYEDPKSGLVWIGLAKKSMLLDAKNGRQLANECKT